MWKAVRTHPVVAKIVSAVVAVLAILVSLATIWPVLSRDTVPEFLEKQGWLLTMPSWQVVVILLISSAILVGQAAILRAARRGVGHLAARMLDLRATYREIETELLSIQREVALALDTESWWPMGLPAFAWQKHHALLTRGESAEEQEVLRVCRAVYVLADAANKLVHRYHANAPTEEHLMTIRGLQDATDKALALLGERLRT
jgi:hypothetical protein